MRSNYRVLHFDISFFPDQGGSFFRLYNLIRYSRKLDHAVVSNTLQGPKEHDNIPIFRVKRKFTSIIKYYKTYFAVRPDAIIIHNSIIAIYLLPILIFTKCHRIIEIHSVRSTGHIYDLVNSILYKYFFDTISVLSSAMKNYLMLNYGVPEDKIAVIYNGYQRSTHSSVNEEKKTIIKTGQKLSRVAYIGSMHVWQGIPDLLKAAKVLKDDNINDILVEFIGDGPLSGYVAEYIKEHSLEKFVSYRGHIDQTELKSIIKDVTVLIIPRPSTISTETIVPIKIFEYATYRRPIIMSNVGGLTEVLVPNRECLTYIPGDVGDLAAKIRLLIDDKLLQQELSDAAFEKISSYHDWQDQADYYEKVILNGIS